MSRDVIGLLKASTEVSVAVDLDGDVVREPPLVEVVGVEVLGDRAEVFAQRLGPRVEVHPDEAAPGVDAQRAQVETLPRRALREAVRVDGLDQAAVDPVLPAVVEAREELRVCRRRPRRRLPRCMQTL
jgi:hypothetical protein